MVAGDPDLYKAFCWRFWQLTNTEVGRIGVVVPRSALAAKGSTKFRMMAFNPVACVDVKMLASRAGWVFDEAAHRETLGLLSIKRVEAEGKPIRLLDPVPDHLSRRLELLGERPGLRLARTTMTNCSLYVTGYRLLPLASMAFLLR